VLTVTATDADLPAQTLLHRRRGRCGQVLHQRQHRRAEFRHRADFEAPTDAGGNNVYDVTVQVSDGTLTSTQAIAVTVTPERQHPGDHQQRHGQRRREHHGRDDGDRDRRRPAGPDLSYSIVGGADAAKFSINSSTGALSFVTAPDFEAPTDAGGNNVYDVTVQVSDGTLTSTQAIAVTVTPPTTTPR
jgi:serralysin